MSSQVALPAWLVPASRRQRTVWRAALACLILQAVALALLGPSRSISLLSNLLQFVLGVMAAAVTFQVGRRSGPYARRVWYLTSTGLWVYTAGQGIVIYYENLLHAPLFIPWFSDQFLFFWVAPLLMAVFVDPLRFPERFDWALALDFAQVILFALALHMLVVAAPPNGQERAFFEWKIRLVRDGVVLGALVSRTVLAEFRLTRALFARLSLFYFTYALGGGVYLYVEAAGNLRAGTPGDLLWSFPRVLIIGMALAWQWSDEKEFHRTVPRKHFLMLHLAPVLAPLLVLAITAQIAGAYPLVWGSLVVVSFVFSSLRLLVTQTRQEQALNELSRSHALISAVIEGVADPMYVKNLEGRYVLVNSAAARFLGRTVEEVMGRTDRELMPAEAAALIAAKDREIILTGEARSYEVELPSPEGTRTFLSTKNPHRDPEGRIIGTLGVSVDITDHRRMEEQVRKAQRMESIGTLSGGIAHDFNNVLTVIQGYSDLLLATVTDAQAHESIEQIAKASDRAAALTRQLLAFSRQQVLQPRVIQLNDIIHNLHKMLSRLIGEDIMIRTALAPDLGPTRADPGQIEQVLMNLAANGRDAMPRGGALTIETANAELDEAYSRQHLGASPGSYVLLAVSDTGTGMDAQTQARVFEPFFTTKPTGKGTGLGLSTVYGIVKQSGGYIWVYSEPGVGTSFKIYLPKVNLPLEDPAEEKSPDPPQRGTETVLLAEDDPELLKLVRATLESHGYSVLTGKDCEHVENISRTHDGPIHLLLTDVVMPRLSGRELAKRVARQRASIRILFMSGYTPHAVATQGVLEPGTHLLQKPFTPAALAEKVRQVLDSK